MRAIKSQECHDLSDLGFKGLLCKGGKANANEHTGNLRHKDNSKKKKKKHLIIKNSVI